MRRSAALMFILLPTIASAQIHTERLSLIDTGNAELYRGFPNELRVSGLAPGDSVSFSTSRLLARDGNLFSIMPDGRRTSDTLIVYRDGAVFFREDYGIGNIPDPKVCIGAMNITSGMRLKVKDLTVGNGLIVRTGNFRSGISIMSFQLGVLNKAEYLDLGETTGNKFPIAQQLVLAGLQAGDKVYIDNITASMPDRSIRRLVSIALMIVE